MAICMDMTLFKQASKTTLFIALNLMLFCSEPKTTTNDALAVDKAANNSIQTSSQTIDIPAYNLTARAPADSSISDLMGNLLIKGSNLAVTLGEPSEFDPPELEAAVTDFEETYDDVRNVVKKKISNGWYFTAENEGMGTNYWLVSRITINDKAYSCGTTASTPEQQNNAVDFCTSLKTK